MTSEHDLERLCAPKTLQRARQIASSDQNILTKKCRFGPDGTRISAFVASSHGWNDCYRTSVLIDEDAGRIADYSCTCPASLQYDGPCKHCAALVYSYEQRPERFMGYTARRKPATTAGLAELIRRPAAFPAPSGEGAVDIEPTLVYGYRVWSVRFKVAGPRGSYVMKDPVEFADLMKRGAYHSYGKKLAFAHVPEAFSARGRAIARIVERIVAAREGRLKGVHGTPQRAVSLNEFEVVDLLDAMGDARFVVEGADYGVRSRTEAHVVEADPAIAVRLVEDPRGGVSIERGEDGVVISCAGRMYLWEDDVFYRASPALARCAAFLSMLYAADSGALFVGDDDLPLFCAHMLPRIEEGLEVAVPPALDAYRPVACVLEFYFDKTDSSIVCEAVARYGSRKRLLCEGGARWAAAEDGPRPLPDEAAEQQAMRLISSYFPEGAADGYRLPLGDSDGVAALLFGGLSLFAERGSVFTTAAFDRLTSETKPRVSVGVSLAGNLIDLDVHASDLSPDELAGLLASYRMRKRYHRLANGAFLDIADLDLAGLERIAADLDIPAASLAAGVELPAYRAFYLDEALGAEARRDAGFKDYVERFQAAKAEARAVPEALAATLRPYQREGFSWMNALCDMGFGGILADEMGLGKSVQCIAFILAHADALHEHGPVLLICPASLVYNWTAEFARFSPTLRVAAVAGSKRDRASVRARGDVDVFVTSYDLARIDVADYEAREFFCCVLDEAQYIKNHGTLTARAVKRIRARQRFALTGTPMENRLSEIWSIFDFLMPGFLGSYMRFRERFELDIIGGDESAAARLQALAGPFMLRRLKADVLPDLPDKLESAVYVQMARPQEKLYLAYEQKLRESLAKQRSLRKSGAASGPGVEVLAELTRLRQLCCDPRLVVQDYDGRGAKVDAIADLIDSARNDGQKTLVFSQFTGFLSLIADALDASATAYYTITGATPKKQRVALVDAFNEDDTPVFLVSLKAGGTGLNLTGASVVVHADPWWNAAAQDQATDRAHRIGQRRVVSVHRVIAKNTIEERIVALQQAKSELAGRIVGANANALASLDADDLLALLQG